jgi:hypothetical protein
MSSAAAFLALGGGAYAASSLVGRDGTINGCVTRSGTVRVLAPGKKCAKREKALSWSQRGPQGTTGLQGQQGGQGPKGDPGVPGQDGPPGSNGTAGTNGAPGTAGTNGAPGTARAYAYVNPATCSTGPFPQTCVADKAKGVSAVLRTDVGQYCITAPGIDAGVEAAAASVEWYATAIPEGNTSALIARGGCIPGPPTDFMVVTQRQPMIVVRDSAGTGTTSAVGYPATANNVSFSIVIP